MYAVAQQMKWIYLDELGRNVLCMGRFHMLPCIITSVSTLWSDAGLYFLVEFVVYTASTAD